MGCFGSKNGTSSKGNDRAKEENAAVDLKVAWERIREAIPRNKDPESKNRRVELFKLFDRNGSGRLSFDEVLDGCYTVLKLDEFTSYLPEITQRAFDKAKDLGNTVMNEGSAGHIEFFEFRLLLCYIYDLFELTVMFDAIDKDGSLLVNLDEFKGALPKLKEWGIEITDADAVFSEIDTNGSGTLTFDEFSKWAVDRKLTLFGDPDGEGETAITSADGGDDVAVQNESEAVGGGVDEANAGANEVN